MKLAITYEDFVMFHESSNVCVIHIIEQIQQFTNNNIISIRTRWIYDWLRLYLDTTFAEIGNLVATVSSSTTLTSSVLIEWNVSSSEFPSSAKIFTYNGCIALNKIIFKYFWTLMFWVDSARPFPRVSRSFRKVLKDYCIHEKHFCIDGGSLDPYHTHQSFLDGRFDAFTKQSLQSYLEVYYNNPWINGLSTSSCYCR